MVLVVKDRIKDTSTTSGTGTITLANSPPNGFQAFSVLGNNSTTYYAIQDANNAFEIGLGTYNSNTLTRTTVLASSNSGNLVSLTSPISVWVDYPASKAYLSEEGIDKSFTATASITAGKPVILNSAGTVTQVSGNLDNNYLGVASTSASANASVNINIVGSINNNQTSLTVGRKYYTSASGVISTTLSPNFVGRAISSTQLLLGEEKGNSLDGFSNGAITKGKPVVMQSDGDFAQVSGSSSGNPAYNPNTQQISGGNTDLSSGSVQRIADNGAGTFCVVFEYSGGHDAMIGVDNGTSITWGSEVNMLTGADGGATVYYDPDEDKFIVTCMNESSSTVKSTIVSYSGTTATRGTQSSTLSTGATADWLASAYDTTNNKGYVAIGNTVGKMLTVTVSGSTITQSALSGLYSSTAIAAKYFNMVYDNTNNRGYITYRNESISDYPYLQTYSVSGNTFTFGTPTAMETSGSSGTVSVAEGSADSKGVVMVYKSGSMGDILRYATPTFSGLASTIGTVSTMTSIPNTNPRWNGSQSVNYNPVTKTFQLAYQDTYSTSGRYDLVTNDGSVSGGTLTWGAYKVVYSTTTDNIHVITGPTGKNANNAFIVVEKSSTPWKIAGSLYGASTIVITTNLTTENYLGLASDTVANNENATIQTQGAVNLDQSSLTPGQLYYVQSDATLSTTAGSPSVVAGIATSATTLLITRS